MTVTLSLFAGAGAQFLDNNGNPLSGGKIYTYQAGTTTPLTTYTTNSGTIAHTNPIVLDAAGRVPSGGEIWLTLGVGYKFVVKTSTEVLIAAYDNIPSSAQPPAANDADSIMYEQGYTVTAGSFVIGKMYRITTLGTTNFTLIGAVNNVVGTYFIATGVGTGTGTAELSQTVESKLRETVSVKDFGAVGDGVTDDSAAFIAAREAALTSGKREVWIPAGSYKLTQENVMGCRDTAAVGVTQGFTWRGAGMRVTEITFANATDYMIVNDDDQQFINYIGISFDGDSVSKTSKFMYVTSASQAQSIRFHDCRWRYWYNIATHEGTATASEMVYNLCKAQTIYGPAFITNNIQSVNHVSIASDWEVMYDDVWWFKKGGHLSVFGGSIIVGGNGTTTGAVLHTDDTSGTGIGFSNWTYNFYGVRTELKDDSKFLNGQSGGFVNLNGCNTEVILGTAGRTIYTLYQTMQVTVNGGWLDGKVYLQAVNASAYNAGLRGATFAVYGAGLANGFEWEIQNVTNVGGKGRVIIDGCKREIAGSTFEPIDQVVGWHEGMASMSTKKRVAVVHNPIRDGGLPVGGQSLTLKLPLNAVVTSVRVYHPAQSGPASQTYTLKNLDGTTTLQTWTFAIGSTQTTATTLYHVCSSDNNRTLIFAGDVTNDTASYNGHLEVEYIA